MKGFKNPYVKRHQIAKDLPIENSSERGLSITFKQAKKEAGSVIYSSANSVWWTANPKDLHKGPIPLDCFGSPLFENDDVKGWFNADAIGLHPAYGKPERRLRNFMLAHAKNIHLACDKMPPRSFSLIKDFKSFVLFCDENDV